jgi:hypothetical protein
MLIKIHYLNCEEGEGTLELRIIEDSSLELLESKKDKIEKLLSDYAKENIFMTSAHFFVDMLATYGIVAEELNYDIEIY